MSVLEQLLEEVGGFVALPEQVRALRAVKVLEVMGGDEARACCGNWPRGRRRRG